MLVTIDPNRPWVGCGYPQRRIFVLGESYTGSYTDDLEYDDSYLAALLAGKPVLGPDLFIKMAEKLEMSLSELWHQVMFTNMALGSIGATNATKVTPAQLRAGRPRLEELLLRHSPKGVLVLGAKTGKAAEPVCRKLGIACRVVYHPSGINNANPKTACTPSMLRAAWQGLCGSEPQREKGSPFS
ncbi:MAG: uracil-DNA glycosylase family protein [Chromatiaceae bacterium]|nr:uracil-DNA glycosylase family protein [Chromatiaceae bacterium]